jgi:hypothetical protein
MTMNAGSEVWSARVSFLISRVLFKNASRIALSRAIKVGLEHYGGKT